jgi:hypothetical protein
MRGAEAEQGLERSHGCLTTIVVKNELITHQDRPAVDRGLRRDRFR